MACGSSPGEPGKTCKAARGLTRVKLRVVIVNSDTPSDIRDNAEDSSVICDVGDSRGRRFKLFT